jgi:hypothetical protein
LVAIVTNCRHAGWFAARLAVNLSVGIANERRGRLEPEADFGEVAQAVTESHIKFRPAP